MTALAHAAIPLIGLALLVAVFLWAIEPHRTDRRES